jgi:myo-inositol-1(or 4)-monophosphatase
VVYDTSSNHIYAGAIERGATCDNEPITVSACSRLETALIATGFLPDRRVRWQQGAALAEVLPRVRDIRRSGSPILDLCGVACGRVDGLYEWGLGRWDIAAGAVIAQAAGARVTVLPQQGAPSPLLVASTPGIHDELLERVSTAWKQAQVGGA